MSYTQKFTLHLVAATFCALVLFSGPNLARAGKADTTSLGDYRDSPVFFELYKEPYFPYESMPPLRKDSLKLGNFPAVDFSRFDWKTGGINDRSWWSWADRLTFLLPFIDSERETDQALARKWFSRWHGTQANTNPRKYKGWSDPFVVAYRGMVLVFFLKVEEQRDEPDWDLAEKLRRSIFKHQAYLAKDQNFDRNSNHGLLEAIALIEVTRVAHNSELTQRGLDRIFSIADLSVSALGTHLEHSPSYHFSFLRWLSDIRDYFVSVPSIPQDPLKRLEEYITRMQYVAYFLQDHEHNLLEIGDGDSLVVGVSRRLYRVEKPHHEKTTFYDPEAGYAIYKGHPSTGDKRHVVFTNQTKQPALRFHYHDDVLAVCYHHDGEIILGDQGRYEYTHTVPRRYFVSPAAHNTVFPARALKERKGPGRISVADEAGLDTHGDTISFDAHIRYPNGYSVSRGVVIPSNKKMFWVTDSIEVYRPNKKRRQKGEDPSLVMVWNIGRDVKSLQHDRWAAGDSSLVLFLKTRNGRKFILTVKIRGEYDRGSLVSEVARGEKSPMLGWYSAAMMTKRPSPSLVIKFKPTGSMTVATVVEAAGRGPLSWFFVPWRR